jgi:SAM-dependent methyltransferase
MFRQVPHLTWEILKTYYPENYASYASESIVQKQKQKWKYKIRQYGNWKRRRALEKFQHGGRLLEIGCGTGNFLEELVRSGGWEVSGIEPSSHAAAIARQKMRVPIYEGQFSEVELEASSYDVIALWYVLEHLEHPIRDLERIAALLKPGGWIVCSVPNYESLEARIFRQYWSGWDLPRHLHVFPRPLLHTILVELGFRLEAEVCLASGHALLGHSLDFWSQTWEEQHPSVKRVMMAMYYSWIGRLLLALPLKILDVFRLNTTITIFAQKI